MASTSSERKNRLSASLKTPTGSFSQVLAISQGAINNNLKALYNLTPDLQSIKIKLRSGELDAVMNPPKVFFPVDSTSTPTVLYHCFFESGKGKVWDDAADGWVEFDVTNWKFVFKVDMGRINVPSGASDYDAARVLINLPGDYSITRLYLDFTSNQIALYNKTLSSFVAFKFKNDDLEDNFVKVMKKWATTAVSEPEKTTVGYVATTSTPSGVNPLAPSFPPTSLIFQTYPYLAPGSTYRHAGLSAEGDKNMLLYLGMTEKKDFPQERFLSQSGNFVIPGMDGTLCFSREIFWDKFFMRNKEPVLLRVLNAVTHAWVKSVKGENWSADYGVGLEKSGYSATSDFFAWHQTGNTSWTWDKSYHKKDVSGSENVNDTSIEMWCDTNNKMSFTPGTNCVDVSGVTKVAKKVNSHTLAVSLKGFECVVRLHWSLKITINSILKGGMEISLNLPKNLDDAFKIEPTFANWPADFHKDEATKMKDQVVKSIRSAYLGNAEAELQKALKTTAKFVVPGAKVFFFKNAVFTDNGDVMLEVKYDGVS